MAQATDNETFFKVVKFAQALLEEEPQDEITPALIGEKIDLVLAMNPRWKTVVDKSLLVEELVRRFSLWVGEASALKGDEDHSDWLSAARKTDWRYWQRYQEWLELSLSSHAVESLDKATDQILSLLEDPLRQGNWDRRGLVVGHVQSGKTANYAGLICKAADAGYKIVIVLAGLHNNLRSQTQMRLDEGFLGYETSPKAEDIRVVGVGEIDRDPAIRPNFATNRSNNGDFSTSVARNLGITPEQRPWLFVVKKNKTVLDRLLRWVRNHAANATDPETGRKIVTNLPLIVIDDEADHASIDTGEQMFGEDGRPDEEHQPTAINRLVRRILNSFTKSAYVGYTATPFANIFIHERGKTKEEGPDLFPAAFIINLGAPSTYVGPARVFGTTVSGGRDAALPLTRTVRDYCSPDGVSGWMPTKHRNGHIARADGESAIPESLRMAIDSFILATTIRSLRGQGRNHSSMLVHVTRFNSVQNQVKMQVEEQVRHMRQRLQRRIDDGELLQRLQDLFEKDFVPTTDEIRVGWPDLAGAPLPSWTDVRGALAETVADIEVKIINGTAKDALDYADKVGTGLKVIAIGGDKLARGLTLEGLCTSYFLRASKMYDTLMQMGRWFGYRPGYLDLCRLFTTDELVEWFGHITDAAEELREEFDLMVASGATPREYGLKVQSHPVLMVTSRIKMRTAKNLMLSFSGQLLETISLYRSHDVLAKNLDVTRRFLALLGEPEPIPVRHRPAGNHTWTGFLWEGAEAGDVLDFLERYRTHPEAHKVNSALIAEFVGSMTKLGELTQWTIAVIGGGDGGELEILPGASLSMLKRSPKGLFPDRYSIGRLMSPRDEAIDLDEMAWTAALTLTKSAWNADPGRNASGKEPDSPNGNAVRRVRGLGAEGVPPRPDRGLLLLYVLDPVEAGLGAETPPIVAFGVSFPESSRGVKVEYKVAHKLWEQEYGASE